ncbi:MAG TPA: hypothetical protein VL981_13425 [Candidatus Methylacidiphilales bacterium]|nr:hypothetical protein [Candidatus Methylacidiphilales bacterium]
MGSRSQKIPPFASKESRVREAEKIRQDFIKSKGIQAPLHLADQQQNDQGTVSSEQVKATLMTYVKALDKEQLNDVLNEILDEMRRREAEQIKQDLLRNSGSLLGRTFK